MAAVIDGAVLSWSDDARPAVDAGREVSEGAVLREICASLAVRDVALSPQDVTVRWALLIGDLTRLAREAPPPPPARPSRRIGEPGPSSVVPVGRRDAHDPWLTALRAQVVGVLSRYAAVDALLAPGADGAKTAGDALEAHLMLTTADAMLGRHLDWPGRRRWAAAPLGPLIDPHRSGQSDSTLTHLQAHLAAQDARFTPIVPLWQRTGVLSDLGAGPATSALPVLPFVGGAPIRPPETPQSSHRVGRSRRSMGRAWAALVAVVIVGVLIVQHVLWRGVVDTLASQFTAGG